MGPQLTKRASSRFPKSNPPTFRYSREETLTGTLGVRSKFFGTRRRLVRLENGTLFIYNNGDDCGAPLAKTIVCDAEEIVVNARTGSVQVRTGPKVGITLVFKHDTALMHVWTAALRRAKVATVDTYYKTCGVIGRGHYAKVYEAVDRATGEKVAVKKVPKTHAEDPKMSVYAKREAQIARKVNHPNIVRTLDVFETEDTLYVVMEYVEGSLLKFLKEGNKRINEKNAVRIAKQLLSAVAYMHEEQIIHRDIKPENILVTGDGTIKLADFGLARFLDGICCDEYCLSSILGTPAYCSPEVVMKTQYGKPVDLFGCGVLIFIALSGTLPFRGSTPQEVFSNIMAGNLYFPEHRWEMISWEARDFVTRLLKFQPGDRPTAAEALDHAWLRSNGDRSDDERPISPRPFVRNTSAVAAQKKHPARMPRVTSTSSFRRAQSGSLQQLSLERQTQRRSAPIPHNNPCVV